MQVTHYLQWLQYIKSQTQTAASVVWVNMDETAVLFHFAKARGNICHRGLQKAGKYRQWASMSMRRGHCTLAAVICDNVDVQKEMPQFLIPNMKGCKKVWLGCPHLSEPTSALRVITDGNGWMTVEHMLLLLKEVSVHIRSKIPHAVIVFTSDCHASHLAPKTVRKMRQLHCIPLFIPSKLTHMLQPLDVAVFAPFKRCPEATLTAKRLESEERNQTLQKWMHAALPCIQQFFSSVDCSRVFARVGQHRDFAQLKDSIRHAALPTWARCCEALSEDALTQYLGCKRPVLRKWLFAWPSKPPVHVAAAGAKPLKRLHSKTAL